ncbi:MAG: hypothetical protein ACOC9O_00490 [Myxococcota bacterium]
MATRSVVSSTPTFASNHGFRGLDALMRIDVADAGAEGGAIAHALSEAGFEVRRVRPEELRAHATTAALFVLAGDDAGALVTLDHLRRSAETATVPVLLVGLPPDGPSDPDVLRGLGADGVYPRPVPLARLVRKVQTFLTPAEQLRPSPGGPVAPGSPQEASGGDEPVPSAGVGKEPTLQLPADGGDVWQADSWRTGAPVDTTGGRRTGLSPRLMEVVREADRRLFPDSPPVDLQFVDPGDALELLLGDDLLAPAPLPDEPSDPSAPPEEGTPLPGEEASLADATTAMARRSRPPRAGDRSIGVSRVSASPARVEPSDRSVLGPEVPRLVLAGARALYGRDDVLERLASQGCVHLARDAATRFESMGIEPPLAHWLEAWDGRPLDAWLSAHPPGGGAPGLVLALVAYGLLAIREPVQGDGDRAALRARVLASHALAREGDYFAILGVPPDAGTAEIEASHDARHRELMEIGGLDEDLADKREVAVDALAEARRILGVGRLREAYRRALGTSHRE